MIIVVILELYITQQNISWKECFSPRAFSVFEKWKNSLENLWNNRVHSFFVIPLFLLKHCCIVFYILLLVVIHNCAVTQFTKYFPNINFIFLFYRMGKALAVSNHSFIILSSRVDMFIRYTTWNSLCFLSF